MLVVGVASVAAAVGCGEGAEVTPGTCHDDACPAGHVCGATGCEPITAPTVMGDLGRFTSTALLSDRRLVVATYDTTHKNLVVSVERPDGSEFVRPVDGWRVDAHAVVATDSGRWTSLAVDDTDGLHLAWFDVDGGQLRYGYSAADSDHRDWRVEIVDGEGPEVRGAHASVAVAQGVVHIAYRDESARQLRYARRDPDGTWRHRAVDGCAGEDGCPVAGEEDYGEWASMVLIANRPRVAFYDRLRGDLKMASREEDGQWIVTTLDGRDPTTGEDTSDVGRFVSLALTAGRQPGLAYHDVTRGALRYLVPGSAPLTVDDGARYDEAVGAYRSDPVGQHVALRFDERDRAVVMYLDGGAPAVKQAVISGSRVTSVRVVEALEPGAFLSFTPSGDGQLRGAYGAWLPGSARTRLVRFLVPVYGP